MSDRKFYVYVHMKASDDSVFYVGKGCGSRYKVKHGRNQYWQRVVAKYGYVAEIVKEHLTFDEANAYEIALIKELRNQGCELCNLTDGGEGVKGWKKTPEQIAHHKAVTTGMKRSEESKAKMRGRTFSEEALQRIGGAHKNKIVSEETRKKMAESAKARKRQSFTEEQKRRISEGKRKEWASRKNRTLSEETKNKIRASIKKTLDAKKIAKQAIDMAANTKVGQNA